MHDKALYFSDNHKFVEDNASNTAEQKKNLVYQESLNITIKAFASEKNGYHNFGKTGFSS